MAAMKHPVAALCFDLPLPAAADSAPPTSLTLIPAPGADGMVRGVDGRAWKLTYPNSVVGAFNRSRAITENHAGRLAAVNGQASPAFAWIEAIRAEDGAIVADVVWTPRGAAAYNARDYRYLSPEFVWDDKTTEVLAIVGASLVNDPNFTQLALNAEHYNHPEQQPMSLLAIATALGLTAAADEAACVTAITTLKTDKQTALNASQQPDPTRFAPREELTVALNRATTAEGKVADAAKAQADAQIVSLMDQAQAEGKVIPATREHYLAMCRADGGELFKKLLPNMPVLGEVTHTGKKPGAEVTGAGLTPTQLAICAATGTKPEDYLKNLPALA